MNSPINIKRRADINQALCDIMSLSLQDSDLNVTLGQILDVILNLEWLALKKKGCVFLSSDDGTKLDMVAHRNLNTSLLGMCKQISYGQCLCGQAALSQRMVFKSCLDEDHHLHPEGMQPHGHYNIPVLYDGKTLAVINLYVADGHKQKDDEMVFLSASANAVAGVVRRKQAETKLKVLNSHLEKEVEKRTQEIQSLARFPEENPFPVLRVNAKNQLIYANDACKYLLELTPLALEKELPHPCGKHCEEARRDNKIMEFQSKAGDHYYSMICVPCPDESGELNIYGRNITERVCAEYDLSKLSSVVDQTDEIVIVTDTEGLIQYVNPAFVKVSGYSVTEVIGKSPSMLKSGQHDESYYTKMWSVLKKGQAWDGHFINRAKNGDIYEVTQSIALICDKQGEHIGYSSVQHDVTAERKAERKVQHADRLEALGVLAGGIAHDFNNILTAIMGNADLLERVVGEDERAKKFLNRITMATQRAAGLSNQMLAYSGKGNFLVKPCNLSNLVQDVSELMDVSINKNTVIQLYLSKHLPLIEGDDSQLQQIILNLLTNANESLNGDEGVVSITTGVVKVARDNQIFNLVEDSYLAEGEYVYLEVSDTGSGMNSETVDKIFDPFFTTKFTGRGLGMSALLGIIRAHHGGIEIDTKLGVGSSFRVFIPAVQSGEEVDCDLETSLSYDGCKVLFVDDEPAICDLAVAMLESLGFSVLVAHDGAEALQVYIKHQEEINYVLLDMTMPRMNGKQCFDKLLEVNPTVKVILSSGYSEADVTKDIVGLHGFLQKPYNTKSLRKVL